MMTPAAYDYFYVIPTVRRKLKNRSLDASLLLLLLTTTGGKILVSISTHGLLATGKPEAWRVDCAPV